MKAKKVTVAVNITKEIASEARGAVYVIPGMTLSSLFETSLEKHLKALRKKHNGGDPFRGKDTLAIS